MVAASGSRAQAHSCGASQAHRLSCCIAYGIPGSGIEPVSPTLAADSLPLSHPGILMLGNSYSTLETVYENYRNNLRLRMIFFLRMIFCSSRMDLLLLLTDNCIGREKLNPVWDSADSELGFVTASGISKPLLLGRH